MSRVSGAVRSLVYLGLQAADGLSFWLFPDRPFFRPKSAQLVYLDEIVEHLAAIRARLEIGFPDVPAVSQPAAFNAWVGAQPVAVPLKSSAAPAPAARADAAAERPATDRHHGAGHLNQCCLAQRPASAFLCSKPKGHEGEHGYAGVFWRDDTK
jgi:hypothetical protein